MGKTEEFDFKSYMQSVKNRLKQNNYSIYKNSPNKGRFKLRSGMFSNGGVKVKKISNNEDELISKIVSLIDEDCVNPLKELTDEKKFNKMTVEEKQRYMLNLSEKYIEIKSKLYSNEENVS